MNSSITPISIITSVHLWLASRNVYFNQVYGTIISQIGKTACYKLSTLHLLLQG